MNPQRFPSLAARVLFLSGVLAATTYAQEPLAAGHIDKLSGNDSESALRFVREIPGAQMPLIDCAEVFFAEQSLLDPQSSARQEIADRLEPSEEEFDSLLIVKARWDSKLATSRPSFNQRWASASELSDRQQAQMRVESRALRRDVLMSLASDLDIALSSLRWAAADDFINIVRRECESWTFHRTEAEFSLEERRLSEDFNRAIGVHE